MQRLSESRSPLSAGRHASGQQILCVAGMEGVKPSLLPPVASLPRIVTAILSFSLTKSGSPDFVAPIGMLLFTLVALTG